MSRVKSQCVRVHNERDDRPAMTMIIKPLPFTQIINRQECHVFEGMIVPGGQVVRVHIAAFTPMDGTPEGIKAFDREFRAMPPSRLIEPVLRAKRPPGRARMLVADLIPDGGRA